MRKRNYVYSIIISMLLALMMSSTVIAATVSKDVIKKNAKTDFTYKDIMRNPEKYEGKYVACYMKLGSAVGGTDNQNQGYLMKWNGTSKFFDYIDTDGEHRFILADNRASKAFRWVDGDVIAVYGVFTGLETFSSINKYTDKGYDVERPVISVLYCTIVESIDDENIYVTKSTTTSTPRTTTKTSNNKSTSSSRSYNSNNKKDNDYMLPDSDSGYFTEEALKGFSAWECKVARNEIYARHGRKFSDQKLQDYFNSKSWYTPKYDASEFDESVLNQWEKANAKTISDYEKKMGYK